MEYWEGNDLKCFLLTTLSVSPVFDETNEVSVSLAKDNIKGGAIH